MYWYLQVLRKYADFGGRARRKEYWTFYLVNIVFTGVCYGLLQIFAATDSVLLALTGLNIAWSVALILPSLAVLVRRLHDTNHSGWWYWIALVPLFGAIVLLVWLATDGDAGPNQYGPDPKQDPESVSASASGEALQTATQKRARWVLPLTVAAVSAVITGGCLYAINRGVDEARVLAACTGIAAPAEQVANPDMTPLGLQAVGTRDAHALYGDGFVDAAVVEYSASGQPAALVAVLRYSTVADATGYFDGLAAWAQGSCGRWSLANFGSKGVIHCDFSDSHDMILRSGSWILDIETIGVNGVPAPELADRIRDAIATHWQGLSSGS